ncbi:nitrous oxide reductase family maturation protein NosD [Sneathiella chinensis]|uniref:Carbohydrate-binding protein n=2 Tax=Sneathiella chinensis TaxID=349750 RepID=A0ABQ5U1W9_9PROT|nr:nitrous oxide reductase family maturation protein NosD [Sneathiella chinensis]GLQ05170.1 carbohydrate-binding protein [Sneathiella chinensis]
MAHAEDVHVDGSLQDALAKARDGDALHLQDGVYQGPLTITKSVQIIGAGETVIQGNGHGSVITVQAPDVKLFNLTITGSGLSLEAQDSGIFLDKTAENALVEGNKVLDNLIGVYVSGAKNSVVRKNHILGRQDLRMNERGNGVQIWNAPGTVIENNVIEYGRDGIFVTTSKKNVFRDNRMENLRFAIHYMYTNRSTVSGNLSIGNHIGYALMSSTDLIVENNISREDRDHGFLLNYANRMTMTRNVVSGGTDKCIFIYNSHRNHIRQNLLSDCLIGIHFTAGSQKNMISENAFVSNQTQVKYVGTRWLEWSVDGVGNYWSDHVAFDLDKNGIADAVYRPNDLTDQIIWKYPTARLLMNSPAVQVLKYAQTQFPALHPGGVIDSAPLMQVPASLERR